MTKEKRGAQYLFWAVVITLVILSYWIIKPYIISIISAFILAYLARPLYIRIKKRTGEKVAAALCVVIISLLMIIPLLLVIAGVTEQAYNALKEDKIEPLLDQISQSSLNEKFGINLEKLRNQGVNLIITLITDAIKQIPLFLVSIIIVLWGMYSILINWEFLAKNLKEYLPFENKDETVKEIDKATQSIVHGTLIIAILDLMIGAIGFYLLGINSYLLLATLIAILAFIPGLGSPVVWIPLAVFYFFTGEIGKSIGIIVLGILISVLIETFLATKIIEKKSGINPLIAFIGVLGGVVLFGVFGFIIGPLILVYTLKILENLKHEK